MLKVGDRVRIPWGVDVVDGVVVEIQASGTVGRAVVQVDLPGVVEEGGEPATVTLPITALQPADWWPDTTERAGSWATSASYERHVSEALERILDRYQHTDLRYSRPGRDDGYDLLVATPNDRVAIETKYYPRRRAQVGQIRQLISKAQRAIDRLGQISVLVLVTNIDLSLNLMQEQIRQEVGHEVPIRIVTWRSKSDDTTLADTIEPWLRDDGEQEPAGV